MEYYQYFRLQGPPFQPASPTGTVYFSPTHLQGLATLEAGLMGNLSGLTMLTGEAGTGKTTLIYSLLQRDHKRARIAHIADPKLSFLEIMQLVMTQLNLYAAGSTKLDYISALDHLLDLHGNEERIAIVVDESQVLSDDVLEELRLLSNRGQRDDRCLQLILVGQPELTKRLKKPSLRQLNQRISSRGVLRALNPTEAIMYVECRLQAQGGQCSHIFEPRALERLLRKSDGIPRKINMLCHAAMTAAFYASERKVSVRTAKKVADEYQDSVAITYRKSRLRPLVMPAIIAAAAITPLVLVGLVHPEIWPHWLLPSSVSSAKPNAQPGRPDTRTSAHRKGSAGQHETKAVTAPAPVEARTAAVAPAPVSPAQPKNAVPAAPAAPATAKNGVAATATAAQTRIALTASAAAAVTGGAQKQTAMPAASDHRNEVTVKYGDTLEEIAIRYLGSKTALNELIAANPQLTNINKLNVGDVIYLPRGVTAKASHDQTAAARSALDTDPSQR